MSGDGSEELHGWPNTDNEVDPAPDEPVSVDPATKFYESALVDHLLGPHLIPLPPTPESVPRSALQPLMDALVVAVSAHQRQSSHLPQQLRTHAGWRRRSLQQGSASEALWQALWNQRDHEFIRDHIIEAWLAANSDIVEAFDSGDAFTDVFFQAVLDKKDLQRELVKLSATIWALGLEVDNRVQMFRLTVAMIARTEETRHTVVPEPEQTPQAARRDEERAIRRQTRELKKELQRATDRETHLKRALKQLEAQLELVRKELEAQHPAVVEAGRLTQDAQRKLDGSESRVQAERRAHEATERRVERLTRGRNALTGAMEEQKQALATARERETEITSQLAAARTSIREVNELLASIPDRVTQVWNFIRAEQDQVEQDLVITEGGPRRVAEARHAELKRLRRSFLELHPAFREDRPPPLIRRGPLRYRGLGGACEVGASCYLIELAGRRILVDCGIRVGRDLDEMYPDLASLASLDAIIVTHAHTDHVGWLPALVKQFDGCEIWTSPQSRDLIEVMLDDSYQQLMRMVGERRLRDKYSAGSSEEYPAPYDRSDVKTALERLRPLRWGEEVGLRGDLRLSLHPAGHILGAATALLQGDGRTIVISGDFADFPQKTVPAVNWPLEAEGADLLIMESTYGLSTNERPPRASEEERLVERVSRLVRAGGVALIPCFALGRAQEVIRLLADAMQSGAISPFVVWIDGMIDRVNAVYRAQGLLELPDTFREVRTGEWTREEVIGSCRREPCAIVTTSGMMAGGPAVEYAQNLLSNRNNRLFFTGYLDEESPGKKLLNLTPPTYVEVPGETGEMKRIHIAVPPERVQLSAHADRPALLRTVRDLSPKNVLLVHGDDDARASLGDELEANGFKLGASDAFALD